VTTVIDLFAHENLAAAFADRVKAFPDRAALTFYRGSAADTHDVVTYTELSRRAWLRAAALGKRLKAGERVLIALPNGPEFVEVYLGCVFAGLIAVPTPPPGGRTNAVERIAAIIQDCRPALIVTDPSGCAEFAEQLRGFGMADVPVVPAEPAGPGTTAPVSFADGRRTERESVAVIQYSSGSTGTPRGVVLTHGAIMANCQAMATIGLNREVFGSWLPFHHDMGLFIMLTAPLLLGAPVVLMAPGDFVRRPVEWLRMLDTFNCTSAAGPNFAFDLCTRAIPDDKLAGLDLSRVKFIMNGSEPIHLPTMRAFSARFASVGLAPSAVSPCYGLAEAVAYVSTNPGPVMPKTLVVDPAGLEDGAAPRLSPVADGDAGREIVGCGQLASTIEARIVDPATRAALPEGRVGEIWLRGGNVGLGYWNRPEMTEQIFGARIEGVSGSEDDGPWLRTGDLGAVSEGEIFVTGRIKELLIIRGRNLYPQDVEQQARAAHAALDGFLGAAFGVGAHDERMVLVHEVNPQTAEAELPGVASTVARRLTTEFGVPVRNVMLVRRGTVRRTTSGKIQRSAMRERFLAGDLAALHAELEPEVRELATTSAESA